MTPQTRNRWVLIALFVLFFGGAFAAGALRFLGWQPAAHKNHGELLQPPGDLRALTPRRVDGTEYAWVPAQRLWRVAVVAPADCEASCLKLIGDLDKVWQLLGHRADQVELLWIGTPPAAPALPREFVVLRVDTALLAGLPRATDPAGTPVYVLDPNGFAILRYAPGFDPAGLRADLGRLLKLQ